MYVKVWEHAVEPYQNSATLPVYMSREIIGLQQREKFVLAATVCNTKAAANIQLALVCNNLGNSKGINVLHKIIENFK
jgi:hypothetical protein